MNQYCINEYETILEAMQRIEGNNSRCAIVVNSDKKVVGVLSQGDIIRAMMRGMNIYSDVSEITQVSYAYLKEKDIKKAVRIFIEKGISLLPVVDHNFNLKDIISLSDILKALEEKL